MIMFGHTLKLKMIKVYLNKFRKKIIKCRSASLAKITLKLTWIKTLKNIEITLVQLAQR